MAVTDNPINDSSEDLLRRDKVAASIANSLRRVDSRRGYVYGILGPWGSGKTSLINLVREKLNENPAIPVLDFNPWMFSGAEQLIESFFVELSAQLRLKQGKYAAIADRLDAYSRLVTPLAFIPHTSSFFAVFKGLTSSVKQYQEARKKGLAGQRKDLEKELRELKQPIIVVLDDIDRLTSPEIREIFKLVRLTASFPNIIYVLAFDRARVEAALDDDGTKGRDYLEKIIQSAVDIPHLPQQLLLTTFGRAVQEAIDESGAKTRFDENRWPDVLSEIIWPLIKNMRDVRRYASSIDSALQDLQEEIELVDILALEAVRIFMPDTFTTMYPAMIALTSTNSGLGFSSGTTDPSSKAAIDALILAAGEDGHPEIASDLLERLFPAGLRHTGGTSWAAGSEKAWLKDRRVAHIDLLRRYMERLSGEGMKAFVTAETLYATMSDPNAFYSALAAVDPDELEDTIAALEVYEYDFPSDTVLPGTVGLLNVLPRIPERERDMWQLVDPRLVVGRVTLRLLRRLASPEEVLATVKQALPQIDMLYPRYELITTVGYQQGAGHKLIDEAAAKELEAELAQQMIDSTAVQLAKEMDLLRLLFATQKFGADVTGWLDAHATPTLVKRLVQSARSEVRSQTSGSRATRRSPRLAWDILTDLFGSEDKLKKAIDSTRKLSNKSDGYAYLLELADRYISGWRPKEFGDDE